MFRRTLCASSHVRLGDSKAMLKKAVTPATSSVSIVHAASAPSVPILAKPHHLWWLRSKANPALSVECVKIPEIVEYSEVSIAGRRPTTTVALQPLERPKPRAHHADYRPLSTQHPAFGQQQIYHPYRPPKKQLLSTVHPAFGDSPPPTDLEVQESHSFDGPVTIGGFFLAVDPHVAVLKRRDCMNPNAQLTIRDDAGHMSRVRYRCELESTAGFKLEAIVRFQIGWLSPPCRFAEMPQVIHLGSGYDVSIPFLLHFTMINILDEQGNQTGSTLYFSGTPFLGVSLGFVRIKKGRLVLNLRKGRVVDIQRDSKRFVGSPKHKVHWRQLGFVAFKCFSWAFCILLCVPHLDFWNVVKSLLHQYAPPFAKPTLVWALPVKPREEEECSEQATLALGKWSPLQYLRFPRAES